MVIRKSFYKRIELRRAWLERKERATAAKEKLRWRHRGVRFRKRGPLPRKPTPEEKVFVEAPPKEIPSEPKKAPEEKPSEKEAEIPPSLFSQ